MYILIQILYCPLAFAKLSPCIDRSSFAAKISYQWDISPSVGIVIKNTALPKLLIKKGQLKGGKTYTVTVVVSMQQDSSLSVTETVTIKTVSSDLIARIKGTQFIGADGTLKLDGSKSSDPDESSDPPSYRWQVSNADGSAVVSDGASVKLPKTASITVGMKGKFTAGKYIFTLTYRVGKRQTKTKHSLEVVAGDPPSIVFVGVKSKVNPSKKLQIEAAITSGTSGTFKWTSETVDSSGNKNYSRCDHTYQSFYCLFMCATCVILTLCKMLNFVDMVF